MEKERKGGMNREWDERSGRRKREERKGGRQMKGREMMEEESLMCEGQQLITVDLLRPHTPCGEG